MILLGILILIVIAIIGALGLRGWQSQTSPELGLVNGHLRACPDKPNCVNSEAEAEDQAHAIAPLPGADWQALKQVLERAGGIIINDNGQYLHAEFTSALFRFADDVELFQDSANGVIHIRSVSRVGHSDFGVNRKRVESIRRLLNRS